MWNFEISQNMSATRCHKTCRGWCSAPREGQGSGKAQQAGNYPSSPQKSETGKGRDKTRPRQNKLRCSLPPSTSKEKWSGGKQECHEVEKSIQESPGPAWPHLAGTRSVCSASAGTASRTNPKRWLLFTQNATNPVWKAPCRTTRKGFPHWPCQMHFHVLLETQEMCTNSFLSQLGADSKTLSLRSDA